MEARILSVTIICYLNAVFLVYSVQDKIDFEVICIVYTGGCYKVPRFDASETNCSCFLSPRFTTACVDEYDQKAKTIELNNILSSTSRTDIIRNIILYTLVYGSCTRLPIFGNTSYRIFKTIDRCPEAVNETLKRSCENPLRALPLINYEGHMYLLFKNIHCAKCHGVSSEYQKQLKPMKFRYHCQENVSSWNALQSQLSNTSCSMEYNYTYIPYDCHDLKYFEAILAEDCNKCFKLNTTIQNLFDNEECIVCKVMKSISTLSCRYYDQNPEPNEDLTRLFRLPDLQKDELVSINHETFKSSELCADDENFDNLFSICRPFTCYDGKIPYRGTCVEPTNTFLKSSTSPLLLDASILNVTVKFCELDAYTEVGFDIIYHQLEVGLKKYILEKSKRENVGQFLLNSTNLPLTKFLLLASSRFYDLVSVEISFEISNWPTTTDEIEEWCSSEEIACYNHTKIKFLKEEIYAGVVTDLNQTLMYPVDSVLYNLRTSNRPSRSFQCDPEEIYIPGSVVGNQRTTSNSARKTITALDFLSFTEVCVCIGAVDANEEMLLSNKINCSHKLYQYKESEYTLTDDNELLINGPSTTYTILEFYIGRNSVAYVCFHFSSGLAEDLFGFGNAQKYLSWTCTGLSCLCLLVSIFLHLLLTDVNSTPRKLQLFLSIYLLLAQCLLQFPNLYLGICRYLAALTHFAWLSVFTWMTALAVNIYFTFGKFSLAVKFSSSSSSFVQYLSVCTLFPFLVVGICFSLDHIPDSILRVRYGQGSCTWISDFEGLIYFFYVPVAISLTVNFYCFCSALWYMKRTSDVSLAEQGHNRNLCIIYIKMSSLMGFTWLFGFIAAFANTTALWYVYIVLNGLQGCFIFVSFHFNSRTGHLLWTKFKSEIPTLTTDPRIQKTNDFGNT